MEARGKGPTFSRILSVTPTHFRASGGGARDSHAPKALIPTSARRAARDLLAGAPPL